ncbi:hypothetical protein BDR26DRAFT_839199 [Obelidium mucronatum]|nr:hypothetical protein BDR26DRAFT_839199 [Obelidium mucronatum]
MINRIIQPNIFPDVTIYTIVHHIPCDQEITQSLRKLAREILSITKSPCNTILAALTYIDRYFIATNRFNEEAPHIQHRLFLSTLITAHKYCSDVAILNKAWLEVCGDMFTAQDVNSMEREFLTVIRYSLVVEDEDTQERWLETIQGLTEEADAYMMVRRVTSTFVSVLHMRLILFSNKK